MTAKASGASLDVVLIVGIPLLVAIGYFIIRRHRQGG